MSKAEERAQQYYDDNSICCSESLTKEIFIAGYEQAEQDLADIAAFSSGPDGFYYGRGYQQGKKDAEKDLTLTPDDIKLITKIHYEIVFKDTTGIKVGDVASEVLKRYLEEKK